jgi:hypothetical protein
MSDTYRVAPSPVAVGEPADITNARACIEQWRREYEQLLDALDAYDARALTAPSPVAAITAAMVEAALSEYECARANKWFAEAAMRSALEHALAAADGQPSSAPIRTTAQGYTPYRVREDMGRADLTIVVEEDGDVIVGIARDGFRSEAQFCTPGSGGGKSPLVHAALRNLANAVASSAADGQRGEG